MRLVKVNDIILNMDRISIIEGSRTGDKIYVYAYTDGSHCVKLGRCESESDYQRFMDILYEELQDKFEDEVISRKAKKGLNEEELKELWI